MRIRPVMATLAFAAALLGAGTEAARADAPPVARSASLVDDAICDLLTGRADTAARRVMARGARNRWYGALLADVVLESAKYLCPRALSLAKRVVVRLFRTGESPGGASTARAWNLALPDLESFQVAVGLGVATNYVSSSVADLCADLRAGRNPVSSLMRWYPRARLAHLRGLNGLVSLAARRCRLAAPHISALSSAMLQVVLSKESSADIDPPAAWFTDFRWARAGGGSTEVFAYFAGADRGSGVARFALWIGHGGIWRRLTTSAGGPGWRVTIPAGREYRWAVQAVDRAGNRGPIVYSTVGRS